MAHPRWPSLPTTDPITGERLVVFTDAPVTRSGVIRWKRCTFRRFDQANAPPRGDPDGPFAILDDPAELERAAATFEALPLLRRHGPLPSWESDLIVGWTGADARWVAPHVRVSLCFRPNFVFGEARQLSAYHLGRVDWVPGEFGGERYDGILRDVVGRHVALCRRGRRGADVRVPLLR